MYLHTNPVSMVIWLQNLMCIAVMWLQLANGWQVVCSFRRLGCPGNARVTHQALQKLFAKLQSCSIERNHCPSFSDNCLCSWSSSGVLVGFVTCRSWCNWHLWIAWISCELYSWLVVSSTKVKWAEFKLEIQKNWPIRLLTYMSDPFVPIMYVSSQWPRVRNCQSPDWGRKGLNQ